MDGNTGVGFGLQIPGMTVRDVSSSVALTNLAAADSALAGNNVLSETTEVHPVCNFYDTGGDGHFPNNNSPFPNGGGDNFTTQVSGTIIIPTAGAWTFGINSDDGGLELNQLLGGKEPRTLINTLGFSGNFHPNDHRFTLDTHERLLRK